MGVTRSIVVGLAAGVVGAVALTAVETLIINTTGQEPSDVPGQVGAKLSGHDPDTDPELVARLNPVVHWTHGIAMGGVRGALGAAGLEPVPAAAVFTVIVWGGDALLYDVLGIAEPPWRWTGRDLATDVVGKATLALVTSAAYVGLERLLEAPSGEVVS